jgi:hypothetical protein
MVMRVVMLTLVAAAGVGVVVNPGVASQLIGAGKLLAASGVLARVRLFARVGTDMASLVLKAVEGLVTERALVRARQLIRVFVGLGTRERTIRLNDTDGCGSHGAGFLNVLVGGRVCRWVE